MNDLVERYRESVDELLAATIRRVQTRDALSAACEATPKASDRSLASAIEQAARLATYDADQHHEEVADRYVWLWAQINE